MKFFISYRLTGEDYTTLRTVLTELSDVINELGHSTFIYSRDITHWKEKSVGVDLKSAMEVCFDNLRNCDALLAISTSKKFSEGMIMEIGYAISESKKIYLATSNGANLPKTAALAHKITQFENLNDLSEKVSALIS